MLRILAPCVFIGAIQNKIHCGQMNAGFEYNNVLCRSYCLPVRPLAYVCTFNVHLPPGNVDTVNFSVKSLKMLYILDHNYLLE